MKTDPKIDLALLLEEMDKNGWTSNAIEYVNKAIRAYESHGLLLKSLEKMMGRLEDGTLIRDIAQDREAGWTMRMVEFVQELNDAQLAIIKGKNYE